MKLYESWRLRRLFSVWALACALIIFSVHAIWADPGKRSAPEVPVKGMVTLLDLGSNSCVPCRMMAPILEKLEKAYLGKASIIVVDVFKDREQARRFGIRAIPTQIFFDKDGKEVYRHVGFMAEAAIVAQLKKMGVQ
jgi:thioredoxin 1